MLARRVTTACARGPTLTITFFLCVFRVRGGDDEANVFLAKENFFFCCCCLNYQFLGLNLNQAKSCELKREVHEDKPKKERKKRKIPLKKKRAFCPLLQFCWCYGFIIKF